MDKSKDVLLLQLWDAQNEAYDLMSEYDALPHYYGENLMYQAEGQIVDLIAAHPGITVTDIGNTLKKTASACSQIVRKLRDKGWVQQVRNAENNRVFNLTLTQAGQGVYQAHLAFTQDCQQQAFALLEGFTAAELAAHLAVQRQLNKAYCGDVQRSRAQFQSKKDGTAT